MRTLFLLLPSRNLASIHLRLLTTSSSRPFDIQLSRLPGQSEPEPSGFNPSNAVQNHGKDDGAAGNEYHGCTEQLQVLSNTRT